MAERQDELPGLLERQLRHRLRAMAGRDPRQRGRATTPLELLYDLTYVIAFAAAADQLAHHLSEGHVGAAVGAYAFAIFSVTWAWMNFTWFSSGYDNDDAVFRVATLVQMIGVIVLTFGLPVSFEAAARGESPNNILLVVGYIIMRVPLVGLWLRAARQDRQRRRTAVGYAVAIGVAQTGWLLSALLPLPVAVTVGVLAGLAVAEMVAPVLLERRLGAAPWNAGHIAERFGLLTLITLGEVVAATTNAVAVLIREQGWTPAAVVIIASGIVLATALWWAYFLVPSRPILERWPERTFAWRYAHLPIFGAIAAVGAGLRVATAAVEDKRLTAVHIALSLAVPTAVLLLMIFATWSLLMRSYDLTHIPLLVLSLLPLAGAVAAPPLLGSTGPIDPAGGPGLTWLVVIVALVALSALVEVVGHERVGFRHTVRVLDARR
ncbi:low temperature requirement protein A [Dactylosporangium aurantiacum]|uniref:Low temperature requirement protein A n=1 Tax=Dactylosporangium aurantiacum TaxID=35754 RepID=A0A9Q9MID6_9ACTN|nr:low temperature requirement protein A [Dactylosporangium aurantiacum]MDG6108844.1 low temperature requirement protein A [Dactylosporangium aurantiacum]UWZ55750.1 low temperature requirement protein A [Dactylosporangium aurantiacum]